MTHATQSRLLRINEVAAEAGLTTRAIRYYEEIGLLEPAARSGGDYRLYDQSDLERLLFIRSLRDDAGFSLAQIRQLLEDEAVRERNNERLRETHDPAERRAILVDAAKRVDRQIEILETKAARLATMIDEARRRRRHLDDHLVELDGGPPPHPERVERAGLESLPATGESAPKANGGAAPATLEPSVR